MEPGYDSSISMKPRRFLLFVLAVAVSFGLASAGAEETVNLVDLDPNEGVRESGKELMALSLDLHRLEPIELNAQRLLIGVHGYASEGYEWVYPLQTMDDDSTTTYFFRWDYSKCPQESATILKGKIEKLLEKHPQFSEVSVVGHSLGGVLVSTLIDDWPVRKPTEMHAIAAPLAGMGSMLERCGEILPDRIPVTVRFYQWRTQHKLDGAFKNLEEDPQVVKIEGSLAVTLPDTYRDRRLGHNWAVSWVAERIAHARKPSE